MLSLAGSSASNSGGDHENPVHGRAGNACWSLKSLSQKRTTAGKMQKPSSVPRVRRDKRHSIVECHLTLASQSPITAQGEQGAVQKLLLIPVTELCNLARSFLCPLAAGETWCVCYCGDSRFC